MPIRSVSSVELVGSVKKSALAEKEEEIPTEKANAGENHILVLLSPDC